MKTKFLTEILIDGIGQGLQGRRIPCPQAIPQIFPNGLRSDPRLSCSCRSADEDIGLFQSFQGFKLKRIRDEREGFRDTYLAEDGLESGIKPGFFVSTLTDAIAPSSRALSSGATVETFPVCH
jgi:hypothetical protein